MFRHLFDAIKGKKPTNITPLVDDTKLDFIITNLMNSPEQTLHELSLLDEAEKQRLVILITKRQTSKTDKINEIDKRLSSTNWAQGIVTKAAINGSANAILSLSPQLIAADTEESIERKNELEQHRSLLNVILQTVNENLASAAAAKPSLRSSPRRGSSSTS